MTSEVATSSGIDADRGASVDPSGALGAGMAHRARTQSVLGQHWSPAGLIGAVGRASVGFGLAVGRSRAIRPTVRFDDLNSAALRPSLDLWRMRRDDIDDIDDSAVWETPDRRAVSADAATRSTRSARSARSARSTADRLDRRRSERRTVGRPSWTDQIIQRSAVGYVAPAPGGPMPEPATPAGFVSTGDAKLDRLRLLVAERDGGAVAGAVAMGPDVSGPAPLESRDHQNGPRRADVGAVGRAMPGALARSMRPEPASAGAVPSGRAGGSALPGGQRSAERRPTRAPAPDKMDLLRAALIERGLLGSDDPGDGSGTAAQGGAPVTARSTENGRTEPRRPRIERDTVGHRPPPSGSGARDTGSDAPPASPSNEVGTSRVTNTSAELRRAAVDGPSQRPGTPPSATSDDPVGDATHRAEPGRVIDTPDVAAPRVTIDARDVRLQRLLRTGLGRADAAGGADHDRADPIDADPSASETVGDPVGRHDQTLQRSAAAVTTSSSIAPAAVATLPTLSTAPATGRTGRSVEPGAIPALVSAGVTDPTTVIRRVTLPRALSTRHRPAPGLARSFAMQAQAQAHVDGLTPTTMPDTPAARVADSSRPSVVAIGAIPALAAIGRPTRPSVGLVEDSTNSTNSTTADAVTDVATMPQAVPWVRRTPSIVPAGPGALLDVVRRSIRPAPPRADVAPGGLGERSAATMVTTAPVAAAGRRDVAGDSDSTVPRRSSEAVVTVDRSSESPGPVDRRQSSEASVPVDRSSVDLPSTAVDAGGSAAERVAEQFMTTLSETVRRRPAPLPTTFRPMADAIAGPRPVMLSTDAASRRALRSVGKIAATTGDTIHLDERAVPAARLAEVMAHELTHVAHPSPAPRFFDDIDDSPEERRAEHVAKVMARSPLAPAASLVAPSGRDGARTIRRSPAVARRASQPSPGTPPSSARGVSAEQLAARLSGAAPAGADVIRRTPSTAPTAAPPRPDLTASPVIRREVDPAAASALANSSTRESGGFLAEFNEHLPQIMRLIEDRMIIELERRGGRTWGNL
jgi:hypothetical protein